MFRVLRRAHGKTSGVNSPRQGAEGCTGASDNTGHGLVRVTVSVMEPKRRCLNPRRRRGDITIRQGTGRLSLTGSSKSNLRRCRVDSRQKTILRLGASIAPKIGFEVFALLQGFLR